MQRYNELLDEALRKRSEFQDVLKTAKQYAKQQRILELLEELEDPSLSNEYLKFQNITKILRLMNGVS